MYFHQKTAPFLSFFCGRCCLEVLFFLCFSHVWICFDPISSAWKLEALDKSQNKRLVIFCFWKMCAQQCISGLKRIKDGWHIRKNRFVWTTLFKVTSFFSPGWRSPTTFERVTFSHSKNLTKRVANHRFETSPFGKKISTIFVKNIKNHYPAKSFQTISNQKKHRSIN